MSTVTVDGDIGPAVDLEGVVFNDIASFEIDSEAMLSLKNTSGKVTQIDIRRAATITVTVVAAGNYTVVIAD